MFKTRKYKKKITDEEVEDKELFTDLELAIAETSKILLAVDAGCSSKFETDWGRFSDYYFKCISDCL